MSHYLLIVEVLEDEIPHSHAVYFKSDNGSDASDYADMWFTTQYREQDEDFELITYEIHHIRRIGAA